MTAMRDLHRRRMRVAIASNDLTAQALQFDRHFFAEFARS